MDYAHGCGFFDIDFVDFGEDVFPKQGTKQHLGVYGPGSPDAEF